MIFSLVCFFNHLQSISGFYFLSEIVTRLKIYSHVVLLTFALPKLMRISLVNAFQSYVKILDQHFNFLTLLSERQSYYTQLCKYWTNGGTNVKVTGPHLIFPPTNAFFSIGNLSYTFKIFQIQ